MKNGDIIKLECQNTKGPHWLEGSPQNSEIKLVASPTKGQISCLWRVHSDVLNEEGVFIFESLATAVGNHWLDGLTADKKVKLSTHTDKPYTGVRWRITPDPQNQADVFFFECLGNVPGNRWLEGITSGAVQLAPSTEARAGARWKVHPA